MENTPDFNLRNLEDYTEKELQTLLNVVQEGWRQAKGRDREEDAHTLDVWCYRIRDAKSLARKRENETH